MVGEPTRHDPVAEGRGGVNVPGAETLSDEILRLENTGEPRPSDPEWVHRRNPEEVGLKRMDQVTEAKNVGEGVGYDPGSEVSLCNQGV
jgi:hypothetical protein